MTAEYWAPHTSSVDFCEPNYLITPYIVEFHNTWSSALITVLAFIGYFYGNPTNELRFSVLYAIMGAVGIGSIGLHSTLHWLPQSSDELPMLLHSLCCIYALFMMKSPKSSQRTVDSAAILFFSIGSIETIIYYALRQIYIVFILSFITSSLVVTVWMTYFTFFESDKDTKPIRLKFWLSALLTFGVFAAAVWLIDMNLCEELMPVYVHFYGFTLHVFWHILSAFGVHLTIQFLVAVRAQHLKYNPSITYVFGVIPVCQLGSKLHG